MVSERENKTNNKREAGSTQHGKEEKNRTFRLRCDRGSSAKERGNIAASCRDLSIVALLLLITLPAERRNKKWKKSNTA